MPVRFGLVGYGLFGRHHARAIDDCEGAELAAIAVKSPESRRQAEAAHPQTQICEEYRELVAQDDVDVVDVVVPNSLHHEIGMAALAAGRHLFIEKPMALAVSQCDELIAAAEAAGRMIAVNHELRLSSLWGGVKRLLDEGAIGRPQYALIELSRFPYRQGSEGWRYDAARVGNWILEEPIHFFDLANWYFSSPSYQEGAAEFSPPWQRGARGGSPESVFARANARDAGRPDLSDNFSAIVNYPGGGYAVISQTLAAFEHHVTAKIAGEGGTIWAWWSAADARSERPRFGLRYGLGEEIHEVPVEKPAGELLELADHVAAVAAGVRGEAPPPCSGANGRASVALCLAAELSAREGRPVTLDEQA